MKSTKTKNPATKKPKTPTLKDLITQGAADRRRMAEMSLHISTLYTQTNGVSERTDGMSRDIGTLIKGSKGREDDLASLRRWANGIDGMLTANAATHRNAMSAFSKALESLDSGQRAHATMISALEKKAADAQKDGDPAPGHLIYRALQDIGGYIYVLASSPFEAERKLEQHGICFSRSTIGTVSGLGDRIIL